MLDSKQPYTLDRVVRLVLTAAAIVIGFALLRYLSDVLVPFAAAAALAYFLNPLVNRIEQRCKRRGLAVGLTLVGITVVGFSLVVIAVPMVTYQVDDFRHNLRRLRSDLAVSFDAGGARTDDAHARAAAAPASAPAPTTQPDRGWGVSALADGWRQYKRAGEEGRSRAERLKALQAKVAGTPAGTILDRALKFVQTTEFNTLALGLMKRLAVGGVTVVNFAVELLIGATVLLVILLYLIFLLLDYPKYREASRTLLPEAYRGRVLDFAADFDAVLRRYFRGQFIIASITGVLFAVGFSIIGLPMAVPFGLFIGVLNMVPYLQMVALLPAAILAVLQSIGADASLGGSFLAVGIVFIIVQVIQDGLITPKIMGKATGLSPIAILLGMFVWGKLLGFLGLLLAIPLTCVGIAYYRRHVLRESEADTSLTAEPQSEV